MASGSADGTGGGTATPAMAMADSAQPEMASIDAGAGAGAAASDSKALNDAKMAVQKAMDDEKWPAVIQHCKEVLAIVVDDQECTDKIEVAKREQDAQLKVLHARTKVPVAEYIRQGIDLVLDKYKEHLPGQVDLFGAPAVGDGE